MKKIIRYSQLKKIARKLTGKKVLVGGCFDFLHIGHIKFLKKAKEEGDKLIVALESDKFIRKNKHRQPFHCQKQRAEILSALTMIDLIILLPFFKTDQDYLRLVETLNPDIIAVTEGDPQIGNKKRQAKKINAQVKTVIPRLKNFASSELIEKFFF